MVPSQEASFSAFLYPFSSQYLLIPVSPSQKPGYRQTRKFHSGCMKFTKYQVRIAKGVSTGSPNSNTNMPATMGVLPVRRLLLSCLSTTSFPSVVVLLSRSHNLSETICALTLSPPCPLPLAQSIPHHSPPVLHPHILKTTRRLTVRTCRPLPVLPYPSLPLNNSQI